MLLQVTIGILLMIQPRLQPFAAMEANIVETCSLVMLLILSTFNVAASARVTGAYRFALAPSRNLCDLSCRSM
jgi:glucan biosynthesis protein